MNVMLFVAIRLKRSTDIGSISMHQKQKIRLNRKEPVHKGMVRAML